MLQITLADLKSDIASEMKGTSIRAITDFYGATMKAANRMHLRIDAPSMTRTQTLAAPFYDNVQDYVLPDDFKRMIDIRPTAGLRQNMPGLSNFSDTSTRQFLQRLDYNSFAIRWNSLVRTLRSQRLPAGCSVMVDDFDSPTSNGSWSAENDMQAAWDSAINWDQGTQAAWDNGLYIEPLNFVQGNSSLGFNLSGVTGSADLVNSTATTLDLSSFNYQDASMLFFYIPVGFASRFTSLTLQRGSNASNYVSVTVTSKADGTAFSDGWNFLMFNWNASTSVGASDNTLNTYRKFTVAYTAGAFIKGCLLDNWTNSLGTLYEIEYYSNFPFRNAAGVWITKPTVDTDLVNVDAASYEILRTEIMIDVTKIIRTGSVRTSELADLRMMLNGQAASRWVKDPPYRGLYSDFTQRYPSEAITLVSKTYDFDL